MRMKTQNQAISPVNSGYVSAVYRQCWPHPNAVRSPKPCHLKLLHGRINPGCANDHSRQHKSNLFETTYNHKNLSTAVSLKPKNLNGTNEEKFSYHGSMKQWYHHGNRTTNLKADFGLDQGTLQWKTWREFREDLDKVDNEAEMFKITQDTFRQLTKQVREVRMQMNSKNTGCGLKSYHSSNPYTKSVVIYPSQLASSLPTQPPSIQDTRERGDNNSHPSVGIVCTSAKQEHRKQRPKSHLVNSPRRRVVPPSRPKSSLCSSKEPPGNHGHLSPGTLNTFVTEVTETPGNMGPFEIIAKGYLQTTKECSGDAAEGTLVEQPRLSKSDLESLKWESSRQGKIYLQRKLQEVRLLPEEGEYQTSNVSSPEPAPIAEALSEPFCYMDLLELSEEDDWRKAVRRVPADKSEEMIMDRLIAMERLQEETSKLESKSSKRIQSVLEEKKGWDRNAAKPTERAQKNLDQSVKSRNCSEECLRPACAGDCPVASPQGCLHCHQGHCRGQCVEYGYHLHVRQPRANVTDKIRPKSCQSCVRKGKKVLNTVNANNVILGRPRSAFSTFSSVQQVKHFRQPKKSFSDEKGGGDILQRLKHMKLVAPKDSNVLTRTKRRVKSAKHFTGRDALLSGKTYHSQRKNSITTETCSTSAARLNSPSLRARSAKHRRIQSAKH